MADTLVRGTGAERRRAAGHASAPAPQRDRGTLRVAHHRHRLPVPPGGLAGARSSCQHTFADGFDDRCRRRSADPSVAARAASSPCTSPSSSVVINTVFGVGISLLLVRYDFPGKRRAQRADRPAAVGVADRRRPGAGARLRRPQRLVRPDAGERRLPGHLRRPRHHHGHGVRVAAAGHPRGRAGARGDRHRAGAGRPQPRRQRACRPSGASRCRRSSGPSSTASCSASPARSASSAPSRSCRATSRGQTQTATLVVEQKYQNFEQADGVRHRRSCWRSSSVACIVVVSILRPRTRERSRPGAP